MPHVVDVQSGYASDEEFCATAPLTGTIRYTVNQGVATFAFDVGGLPHRSVIAVEWINDAVRGYTVAAFNTDAGGRAQTDSLRMFRPGEVKAIGLRLTTADTASTALGQLRPC